MNSSEKLVLTLSPHRNAIKQRVTMLNGKKLLFICSFATLCVQSSSLPACVPREHSVRLCNLQHNRVYVDEEVATEVRRRQRKRCDEEKVGKI